MMLGRSQTVPAFLVAAVAEQSAPALINKCGKFERSLLTSAKPKLLYSS